MAPIRKPLNPKRILERAHQYRVIAERLQFHLHRENLPDEAAELVRTAQEALARAADQSVSRSPAIVMPRVIRERTQFTSPIATAIAIAKSDIIDRHRP
jgi:hypothetical protein